MLTENTVSKLHEMKLSIMAQFFREQMTNHELTELSFEDRFSLIVDAEWASRKSNRLNRLVRGAEYAIPGASAENIEYLPDRKLDKALISRLASCAYVLETNNVIILGATGAGKTYLASALGRLPTEASMRSDISASLIFWQSLRSHAATAHTERL